MLNLFSGLFGDVDREERAFRILNLSVFTHFLARQLYSIFVPVMMLENGYSLTLVLLFLLFSSSVTVVTSYLSQKLLTGFDVIIFNLLAVMAEIGLLLVLSFQEFTNLLFLLIILFEGFYYSFYYISYFALTVHYTSVEKSGFNLGNLMISTSLASLLAPLIGSVILGETQLGLIFTGVTLLVLSLLPLMKISGQKVEEAERPNIEIKEISRELLNYGINASFEVVAFVLWGIYVYINDFSLLTIGLIPAAVAGSRILIAQKIKDMMSDKEKRKKIMLTALTGFTFISVYRYFNPSHVIVTNILIAVFYVGFQLGTQTEAVNAMKDNRTYYSSMLLQTTTFTVRILIILLTLLIGLENALLIPVITATIYIINEHLK